ncbi:hypothetical protein [Loktanella sp. R86503]|uniref:hypothetical protein n=1 Tax=Loktanella sp. R86503 TaxID=3093847 RepID=UPI0036DBF942
MKIAVVGCGPRAVAIAAQCAALKAIGITPPSVTIFEKNNALSAWSGDASFSDGLSLLCTSIERDVGYPYARSGSGKEEVLLSQFSWRAYLTTNLAFGSLELNDWFSRGRPQPSHSEYVGYLSWALNRARESGGIELIERKDVVSIGFTEADRWTLSARSLNGTITDYPGFDGVVITGLGPRSDSIFKGKNPLFFNGLDFWQTDRKKALLSKIDGNLEAKEDFSVVIAGDGGTSAAISAFLIGTKRRNIEITIIGSNPFLDSRPTNFFSDRMFGNSDAWEQLPVAAKHEFLKRTSSGRIWLQVARELEACPYLHYQCSRVTNADYNSLSDEVGYFRVNCRTEDLGSSYLTADALVDARGFDSLWFLPLFERKFRNLLAPFPNQPGSTGRYLQKCLDQNLNVKIDGFPDGLHIPMLGSLVNPASSNLMALGSIAETIVQKYI